MQHRWIHRFFVLDIKNHLSIWVGLVGQSFEKNPINFLIDRIVGLSQRNDPLAKQPARHGRLGGDYNILQCFTQFCSMTCFFLVSTKAGILVQCPP